MLLKPGAKVKLKDIDPDDTGPFKDAAEVEEVFAKERQELIKLQNLLYAENNRAILIILQGMDTSGKDGTIRHVMSGLNPIGVQVTSFKVPNYEELEHDFLWRIHKAVPRFGDIGIFNRSHYEDVLVARVHDLVPRKVWKSRYEQINQFERFLVKNRIVVLKFFLHISKAEQKKRLEERLRDPKHLWKFAEADVAERRFWPAYRDAYEDALTACNTKGAPWHIVPANRKWYRNLYVAETIVQAMRDLNMQYPPPTIDPASIIIE